MRRIVFILLVSSMGLYILLGVTKPSSTNKAPLIAVENNHASIGNCDPTASGFCISSEQELAKLDIETKRIFNRWRKKMAAKGIPFRCYRLPGQTKGAPFNPISRGACSPSESRLAKIEADCGGMNNRCFDRKILAPYPVLTKRIAKRYQEYNESIKP